MTSGGGASAGRPQREVAVRVTELVKRYDELVAVGGVSFEVGRGEFFGILGPNGAGKTTTLEMVEGIREADAGTIEVLGERPWPRNPRLLPRLGVQLQASSFFDKLTAKEQLATFAELYGVPRSRVPDMLELVGLTAKADAREEKLSGGQRQRLSIACALVHDPELVVLDEPTAALDPQGRRDLWGVLRAIQARGTTVLYTTHHIDEAEVLCDRVAIMDAGRILALDAPANLVRGLQAATRVLLPPGALDEATATALAGADQVHVDVTGVVISTTAPSRLVQSLAEVDRLDGVSVRTATLEDVFLDLTGRKYVA